MVVDKKKGGRQADQPRDKPSIRFASNASQKQTQEQESGPSIEVGKDKDKGKMQMQRCVEEPDRMSAQKLSQ